MTKHYREIRDLLAKKKIDGLFGAGASEEQISDCERKLKVLLPLSYRLFLHEYGWGYFGSLELISGLGSEIPQEWNRGANLLQVVNNERQGPLNIPETVLPFCQNGAGDWYALDCSASDGEESPVVFIGHEKAATRGYSADKCADSFADWIFNVLSDSQ